MYVARQIDRWIYIEKDQYIDRQIDRSIDIEKDQYMYVCSQVDRQMDRY